MYRFSTHLGLWIALFSCSCAPQEESLPGTGGSATGGAAVASGGSAPSSSGGSMATGGSIASGGSTATGGVATGGTAPASGGTATTGGAETATGGKATAGSGTGGASAGAATGGSPSGGSGGGSAGSAGGSKAVDPGNEGDGDFVVGPTYTKSPELTAKAAAGKNFNFTMKSADSKIFTGLDTTLNAPAAFTRRIDVHIPTRYVDGTPAPFMIVQDGAGSQFNSIKTAVDNLSQSTDLARRLPAIIVIAAANGGGDSLGSQRGLEYDTMADRYARLVDEEILPAIVANPSIKAAYPQLRFTEDPEGRGAAGCSSGGAAALIMGWFKPDRYRKIIGYSTTLVAQQDTDAPERVMYPHGAWDFHSDLALINATDAKPLRIFINANENDNGAGAGAADRHDWLLANQRTAAALKAKKYHYRYVEGKGAGHCDGKVQDQTTPDALVWLWRGYPTDP